MTESHPITPPPELVQQWYDEARDASVSTPQIEKLVATRAAQYGADQELEACCGALDELNDGFWSEKLRAARRPKPPSLKEQASSSFEQIVRCYGVYTDFEADVETIRRALEALPE
jgi:hypothetical protein